MKEEGTMPPKSLVHFIPARVAEGPESLSEKAVLLFNRLGLDKHIDKGTFVALKTHFGEKGNTGHIKPAWMSGVVSLIRKRTSRVFFTDSNTLYVGHRSNALDHTLLAWQHGFGSNQVDIPVIIADGLLGHDGQEVKVDLPHVKAAKIGSAVVHSEVLVCFSHLTGHVLSGIGGAIKNLGMGCASRAGKLEQHSDVHPRISAKACRNCGICLDYCPNGAISQAEGSARINDAQCLGCGECLTVCKYGAVKFSWGEDSRRLQEKMAEYAMAVKGLFKEKIGFLNFVLNVTKDCDCMSTVQKPVVEDIGLLASTDPVALDRASVDLVLAKAGADVFRKGYNLDWAFQLEHGEKIGLGTQAYELLEMK
jgi:uncharacterized Fe-S center protein